MALDWIPIFPPQVPHRRTRVLSDQIAPFTARTIAVPNILASLTFLPTFPDRVPHLRVSREQFIRTSAALGIAATAPLAWLSRYQDRVPLRRLPWGAQQAYAAPPLGYQAVVAQSLSWQAYGPACVPTHRVPGLGGLAWTIDPSLLSALCVDLGLEGATSSVFLLGALSSPALLGEGLGTPALINEDLC